MIVSAYLPCDTYTGTVQQAYSETIDYIESLINEHECKSVILCGDNNTSFERKTGQVDCLNDFTLQFWHWIWLEAQEPMTGHIYCIMKRTRD